LVYPPKRDPSPAGGAVNGAVTPGGSRWTGGRSIGRLHRGREGCDLARAEGAESARQEGVRPTPPPRYVRSLRIGIKPGRWEASHCDRSNPSSPAPSTRRVATSFTRRTVYRVIVLSQCRGAMPLDAMSSG